MLMDRLNLNQLRIFEAVYRTGSMTRASQELNLTQSGISQHIKSLEDQLSQKLFDRLNQKLVPTSVARRLYASCASGFGAIEEGLSEILENKQELRGDVHLGMPIEFGNNIILPLLTEFSKKHPAVRYTLTLDFASVIDRRLLSGDLDFAFVDEYKMATPILVNDIYEETFELCISKTLLGDRSPNKMTKSDYEALDYLEYQAGAPVLHRWFGTKFPGRHFDLNIKVTVMDVQAIARLIRSGMGAGILPGPVAQEIQSNDKNLVILPGTDKKVVNRIRLARMKDKTLSQASLQMIEFFSESLKQSALENARLPEASIV